MNATVNKLAASVRRAAPGGSAGSGPVAEPAPATAAPAAAPATPAKRGASRAAAVQVPAAPAAPAAVARTDGFALPESSDGVLFPRRIWPD